MSPIASVIAGESFSTKKALTERIRTMLHSYKNGSELSEHDFAFMSEALKGHPRYENKRGCGIHKIVVDGNPIYPAQSGFWIVHPDGTRTDFSYIECLRPATKSQDFVSACRAAISPDILSFKARMFGATKTVLCAITGEAIDWYSAIVDHDEPKFAQLVVDFIASSQIDINTTEYIHDGIGVNFADRGLEALWRLYHNQHARLRIVSDTAHKERHGSRHDRD